MAVRSCIILLRIVTTNDFLNSANTVMIICVHVMSPAKVKQAWYDFQVDIKGISWKSITVSDLYSNRFVFYL